VLRAERYERATRSDALPDLDPEWLVSFLDQPTQSQAVRAMRESMRSANR
jgi:hypothetical protein